MFEDWTQGSVTVDDGIELNYTRTGNQEKPALVLAHGLTDSGLCWHQLANDLKETYDIVMYDAYGHGKSSRIDPNKRFDMVEDLHDLIEALNLQKPGILGHSMGAATAAMFAAKYPDKLAALALEDPPWRDEQPEDLGAQRTMHEWKKQNIETKKKSIKELIKLKSLEQPKWEEVILPQWAQAKLDVDPSFFDLINLNPTTWKELANKITVPTLIITGDTALGAIVTPKLGIEAIQLMQKAEFGHISDAGHCVRYEQYAPYLAMVRLFFKRNL